MEPPERMAWDARVSAMGGHLLQSWSWGELKRQFGWSAERISAGTACAQVLFRTVPGGLGSLAYVPRGPAADLGDVEGVRALLEALRPAARKRRAICLKVEPNCEETPDLEGGLRAMGFRTSPQAVQPRRTILVDLEGSPEAVLERMKQKTRYNIRLAERKGVTVRSGSEADLPAFYRMMGVTAERDRFDVHSEAYYAAAHRLLVQAGRGELLLAEHEGRLLAGVVAMAFGDTACYMYGASSDEGRNLMPTYLLQWEAMRWAQEQGYRWYDLWGVPDEDEAVLEAQFADRSDGLWGVYRFKRGFGGRLVRTAGAWDLIYAPVRYRLYTLALRWMGRGQAG
ncbi:MAG TPA: peptidoglycan bridge formation glycyltransferase FemA/FemB family protein [Anaerolineae bacterium]|nr:peptidoglycan bridge formation glycyltransferase FemA/FemB family protein [Anaerolineae bacterium]